MIIAFLSKVGFWENSKEGGREGGGRREGWVVSYGRFRMSSIPRKTIGVSFPSTHFHSWLLSAFLSFFLSFFLSSNLEEFILMVSVSAAVAVVAVLFSF